MAVVPEEEDKTPATWSSKLQDPIVRSAMLSMGLQLMTGGWGNGTQQLAAGIGAGAAGAEGTAKALQAQAKDERDHEWEVEKHGASQANQAANRKQSETNARIAADSRAEVANIRGEFSMQRAALAAGAKNNNETKQWQADRDAYLKQARSNINNMTKDEKELISSADEYATSKMHARRLEAPNGGGAAGPSAAGGGNGNSAGESGQRTPFTKPTGTEAPKVSSENQPAKLIERMAGDPKFGSQFQADLATPEGQARILKANKNLKKEDLEAYAKSKRRVVDEYTPGALYDKTKKLLGY